MIENHLENDILFSAFDIKLSEPTQREQIFSFITDLKQKSQIIDVQAFKCNSLLSEKHLLSAIWHAWNGFKNKTVISDSLSVEFLLYASGQRQISKALKFFGLEKTVSEFSLVIFQSTPINKDSIFSDLEFSHNFKNIVNISFIDNVENRKVLCSIFNYSFKDNIDELNEIRDSSDLENYILTSISNLVFETRNKESQN